MVMVMRVQVNRAVFGTKDKPQSYVTVQDMQDGGTFQLQFPEDVEPGVDVGNIVEADCTAGMRMGKYGPYFVVSDWLVKKKLKLVEDKSEVVQQPAGVDKSHKL